MILLRQKKFSNPRVRKGVRAVGDSLVIARDNIYRALGIGNPIVNEQLRQEGKQKVRRLSGRIARLVPGNKEQAQIMRQAGKVKALEAAAKAEEYAITHTPGQVISNGVGEFIRRPIATTGIAAGYASIPYIGPVPGTSALSILADETARKQIPIYDRTTKRLINWYISPNKRFVPANFVQKAVDIPLAALPI